mgnify:FL=1|jgi:hypothetical protein
MLSEVKQVTQYESNKHRRWFHDDFFDLYTWENYDGDLLGFQLCYAKDDAQRALRWSLETGYQHEGVDQPEEKPGRAMSAIFVADGAFDRDCIGARFQQEGIELPSKISTFVIERIHSYTAIQ